MCSENVRERLDELKAEDQSLEGQAQQAKDSMAAIQQKLAEINTRRIVIKGGYDELEKLLAPETVEEADAPEADD